MKSIWIIPLLFVILTAKGQNNHINIQHNYGVDGYDLVSYFEGKSKKGSDKFRHIYEGVDYRFLSNTNLIKFKADPVKYLPQYGGWCAYAMASKGEMIKINPKTFELRDGKLYLFYDAYFNNTFEDWIEEGPEELVNRADGNWVKILTSSESD